MGLNTHRQNRADKTDRGAKGCSHFWREGERESPVSPNKLTTEPQPTAENTSPTQE